MQFNEVPMIRPKIFIKFFYQLLILEINEWSDMDPVEFAIEKTGLNPVEPDQRYYETKGWINDPNAANTEEEIADLDRIYSEVDRQSLPASWDSRAKGMFISFEI